MQVTTIIFCSLLVAAWLYGPFISGGEKSEANLPAVLADCYKQNVIFVKTTVEVGFAGTGLKTVIVCRLRATKLVHMYVHR